MYHWILLGTLLNPEKKSNSKKMNYIIKEIGEINDTLRSRLNGTQIGKSSYSTEGPEDEWDLKIRIINIANARNLLLEKYSGKTFKERFFARGKINKIKVAYEVRAMVEVNAYDSRKNMQVNAVDRGYFHTKDLFKEYLKYVKANEPLTKTSLEKHINFFQQ